jgi:hypothetical protein
MHGDLPWGRSFITLLVWESSGGSRSLVQGYDLSSYRHDVTKCVDLSATAVKKQSDARCNAKLRSR